MRSDTYVVIFLTSFLMVSFSESIECNEPILVVSNKLGVCRVDPSGKPCSTLFTRLSYNGTSSVVKCESVSDMVIPMMPSTIAACSEVSGGVLVPNSN